ncbi:endolytic transglycosylase MltG [Oceanobacillus zhaokaii]|uniref:Endolytic murein transglycosylase n=1 Tax=Oceanobacillus zhaokaii TaxID=2052660 RepID=A0A345PHR8_9BACI|nr:endolytic transglycosylase MltG [Oceanobacillus zhaokaii]AXI09548.1 endolytic transglycosylase MltG [Oceanobacillus zhaokaii]
MSKKKSGGNFRDDLVARSNEARTVRKIVFMILIVLIIILAIGGISGFLYVKSALEPVDPSSDESIKVEIPIGSSSTTIADILEENGIIKNGLIFRLYLKLNNEGDFQAGEYTFTPALTLDEIIQSLKTGKVVAEPVHRITIPEGLTVDQIAGIYAEKLKINKEDFLKVVNDKAYIEKLIDKYSTILSDDILNEQIRTPLEGYLYASTYDFYEEEPTIESIVEAMLDRTLTVLTPYLEEIKEKEFTVHEAVTFASLVEKEASNEEQRNEISSVFYNRLETEMPLQTDPTVLYALGEHQEKVLYKDLEVDSPYNTYKVQSLPIGPIANFSESSLNATLNPVDSDYLYFLHDSEGDIHYAETYDEHLENRDKYIN